MTRAQTQTDCGIWPEGDLTHGFWVQIMMIQATALNVQPDFLRLLLVRCLVDILGAGMWPPCAPVSLGLRKLLPSSKIHPFVDPETYLGNGLTTCLKQVMSRREVLSARIGE